MCRKTSIIILILSQCRSLPPWSYGNSFRTQWQPGLICWQILLSMAVISGITWFKHFYRNQIDSGSESHDLFGDFVIISLTSTTETGWNISNISPSNISESEISLFLMLVVGIVETLLNLYARSPPQINYIRFTTELLTIRFLVSLEFLSMFSPFCNICGIEKHYLPRFTG